MVPLTPVLSTTIPHLSSSAYTDARQGGPTHHRTAAHHPIISDTSLGLFQKRLGLPLTTSRTAETWLSSPSAFVVGTSLFVGLEANDHYRLLSAGTPTHILERPKPTRGVYQVRRRPT